MDDFWQMTEKSKSGEQKENAADSLSEVRDKRMKESKQSVGLEFWGLANHKMRDLFQASKKGLR